MKKILLTVYFALISFNSAAQQISWAKNIAPSPGAARTTDLEVDGEGNIYAIGIFFNETDFDPGPGTAILNTNTPGKGNYFCVKYSSAGDFIWAKQIGGTQSFTTTEPEFSDPKIAFATDRIFITGIYEQNIDLDPGTGVFIMPPPNDQTTNFFVASYTLEGDFVWAKGIDRVGELSIRNIEVDSQNNIYLAGGTRSTCDLNPSPDFSHLTTNPSGIDWCSFVLKLSSTGDFVWAREFNYPVAPIYPASNYAFGLAIDNQDNILVTGHYRGVVDFDPSVNTQTRTSVNYSIDLYLIKFDSEGTFQWVHAIGSNSMVGLSNDEGSAVTTDDEGNIYLAGNFTKTIDMDPAPTVSTLTTFTAAIYVAKYAPNGAFIFAKGIECFEDDDINPLERIYDIVVDNNGSLYFTGEYFGSMDCDPGPGVYTINATNFNSDMFLISYSSVNGDFNWAKSISGTGIENARKLAISNVSNTITLGGAFSGINVDFNPPDGYFLQASTSYRNGFLASYDISTLGTAENAISRISLAPIPAQNIINIEGDVAFDSAVVYDMLGKKTEVHIEQMAIDISEIASGVYILVLSSQSETHTFKFIKN